MNRCCVWDTRPGREQTNCGVAAVAAPCADDSGMPDARSAWQCSAVEVTWVESITSKLHALTLKGVHMLAMQPVIHLCSGDLSAEFTRHKQVFRSEGIACACRATYHTTRNFSSYLCTPTASDWVRRVRVCFMPVYRLEGVVMSRINAMAVYNA